MEQEKLTEKLFALEGGKYGDKYIEHLIDQYKVYVNATEKISDRRQKTNEFFLALNTGLVGLLGFVSSKTSGVEINTLIGISAIAGITACYLWYRIIYSYKGLNDAKFKVIHTIETRLPLALYDTEWEMLERGKNKEVYWPFSHIELIVPKIFILIYVVLLASVIPWYLIVHLFCY